MCSEKVIIAKHGKARKTMELDDSFGSHYNKKWNARLLALEFFRQTEKRNQVLVLYETFQDSPTYCL
jgi:hypothetical protein